MPRRMSVWPVAIHTLTPEIGIIGAVRVSARRERPSASQDPPPPRSASVLPPRTRSRSFQGRQSQLPEPHPQSAPAQNRSALLRASAAATQKVDLDEPRRCRSLTRNPHRRKTGRRCCAHLPPPPKKLTWMNPGFSGNCRHAGSRFQRRRDQLPLLRKTPAPPSLNRRDDFN